MEVVNYTAGILWYTSWPVLTYISYKFVTLNISHFEENIKDK
jgi:hypothetical protein